MDVSIRRDRRSSRSSSHLGVAPGARKPRSKPPLPSSPVSTKRFASGEGVTLEQEDNDDIDSDGPVADGIEDVAHKRQDTWLSEKKVRGKQDRERLVLRRKKGLRHYAVKVCKLVQEKGVTTYQDVANDVVVEETRLMSKELTKGDNMLHGNDDMSGTSTKTRIKETETSWVDEKNIRRRVYDSLNVLMAMGVIRRQRKMVTWVGLAEAEYGNRECEIRRLSRLREEKRQMISAKRKLIAEMSAYQQRLGGLLDRNACTMETENCKGVSTLQQRKRKAMEVLDVPFNVLILPAKTNAEFAMDEEKNEVYISVADSFSLWDDKEVLKGLKT